MYTESKKYKGEEKSTGSICIKTITFMMGLGGSAGKGGCHANANLKVGIHFPELK